MTQFFCYLPYSFFPCGTQVTLSCGFMGSLVAFLVQYNYYGWIKKFSLLFFFLFFPIAACHRYEAIFVFYQDIEVEQLHTASCVQCYLQWHQLHFPCCQVSSFCLPRQNLTILILLCQTLHTVSCTVHPCDYRDGLGLAPGILQGRWNRLMWQLS